jgi:hypothetical protein
MIKSDVSMAAFKILILLVSLVLLSSCHRVPSGEPVLFDFESDTELDQLSWSCHTLYSLSSDHATHGMKSLKLDLFPSNYPGLIPILAVNDWQGFKELCFDVYNPSKIMVRIDVRIDDRKNFPDYEDRYNKSFVVKRGSNHISIPLDTLVASGTNRHLNLAQIHGLFIFMANPEKKTTLYIDSIKVLRKN